MIRPGKITRAGLVAIMMVLPNSLWKSGAARANVRVVSLPKRVSSRVSDVRGMDRHR